MTTFWLNLLGKGDAPIPEGAEVEFVFQHAPPSWTLFVFIAVAAAILFGIGRLYRGERRDCPAGWKRVLAGLRMAVLLLALLIFLGPALVTSTEKVVRPYVAVLLDDSLSMSIRDRTLDEERRREVAAATGLSVEEIRENPPSRAEIVDAILRRNDASFVRDLTSRGRVRVLSFSDKVALRDTLGAETDEAEAEESVIPKGDPVPPLNPEGTVTDIPRAFRETRRMAAGAPVAGIVLISDGQNTGGGDPADAAAPEEQEVIPIFTVGIGDPTEPVNLRVVDAWAPENVFRGDPMTIQATVGSRGVADAAIPVELRMREARQAVGAQDEEGAVIARTTVRGGEALQDVRFPYTPEEPGTYIFTIRVAARSDELLEDDNTKSVAVNVLGDKVRVLLVSGSPSWEYRLVKNLLLRDKTVDLSCWLQSMAADMTQEGNTPIESLPQSREELLAYDVLMMFDPDPEEFNEVWIDEIKNFLGNHGGGLMWLAGPQFSLRFLTAARTEGIGDLLPVDTGGLERNVAALLNPVEKREWSLRIRPDGLDHPALQIKDVDDRLEAIWEDLPGVYWSFPVQRAKPGSQVLLEHTDPRLQTEDGGRPLLVSGQYGPGRSMFLGFQGTWRWRRPGVEYFQQFWVQSVRHLASGRLARGRSRGRLLANRSGYTVGDAVTLSAKLYDAAYEPLDRGEVTARIRAPRRPPRTVTLNAVPGQAGKFQGTTTARHVGLNEATIELPQPGDTPTTVACQFTIEMPNVEFDDPRMNEDLLKQIAQRSGGRYVPLDKMDTIVADIPDRRETTVVQGRPIALWDTNRTLALFVLLLTAEWALRKRFRLM